MMPSAAGGVTAVVSIPPALVVDTPGGMSEPQPVVEAPARLKPVLDSPTSGLAPLSFNPADTPAPAAPATPEPVADAPAPAVFAPPAPVAQAPADTAAVGEPVAWPSEPPAPAAAPTGADESALPTRSIFDTPPPAAEELEELEEPAEHDEVTAAIAAQVDEAVSPAMPAALSFDAPPSAPSSPSAPIPPSVEAAGATRLDGPPPRAPQNSRPFFLEDAEPPRAFGHEGAPTDAPAAAPASSAPTPPRLFGGPSPSAPSIPPDAPGKLPGRSTAANGAPPAPLATRRPAATDGPPAAAPEALPVAEPVPDPVAEAAPAAAAPAPEAPAPPVTTPSGLKKRVPRSAGATRAIPGSETERGVAATRRSPEEIRSMLAQHSAGRQRARVQEPVPAGASDERETHE